LGKAPAYRVRVEFYWFNPTLGITRADANLIGATWVDLADRYVLSPRWNEVDGPSGTYLSKGSHAIVSCPETWVPQYVNDGHECLVVRAFDSMLDAVSPDQFSSAADRHVAQRNIAVAEAGSPAAIDLQLDLGYSKFAGKTEIDVQGDSPDSMEWLTLFVGKRHTGLHPASTRPLTGLLPPSAPGSRAVPLHKLRHDARGLVLSRKERFDRGCDPMRIAFHASIEHLDPGQAEVVRIRQKINGALIGGYSVVLMKK
jgi:hypothetical protein